MILLLFKKILQLIFPSYCEWCRILLSDNIDLLCISCKKKIKPLVAQRLSITHSKSIWVYAVGAYEDPLKYLIVSKRWGYRIASRYLGYCMWQYSSISMLDFDCVVAVPIHWTRQAWRGYNQAELMARVICQLSQKEYVPAVSRIFSTSFQSRYDRTTREENVKNVFKLRETIKSEMKGRHVLLVDDLLTSGSTLKYVAKEILKAQPSKLSAVVVARTT